MKTIKAQVAGKVQGVGFRYFVKTRADQLKINGYAKNLPNGQVEVILQGKVEAIELLLDKLKIGPSYSEVSSVESLEISDAAVLEGFSIY